MSPTETLHKRPTDASHKAPSSLSELTISEKTAMYEASIARLAEVVDADLTASQVKAIVNIFNKKLAVNPEALAKAVIVLRFHTQL